MQARITLWLMCAAAVLAWTGEACAQTATAGPMVTLPSGETVWDLNGDWDVIIENLERWEQFGTYPNVFRITQTGRAFSAIRLRDNPPPGRGLAGSPCLQGELDKTGFKSVAIVDSSGVPWESTGHIRADGKKIIIEEGERFRLTLTRP
jgi:hypothetical protein